MATNTVMREFYIQVGQATDIMKINLGPAFRGVAKSLPMFLYYKLFCYSF